MVRIAKLRAAVERAGPKGEEAQDRLFRTVNRHAEQIDWSKMLGAGHFRDRLRPAGPTFYLGWDKGMGIDQDDYTALKKQLVATLEKFNVLERERDDVMTFISSIENDVVEK